MTSYENKVKDILEKVKLDDDIRENIENFLSSNLPDPILQTNVTKELETQNRRNIGKAKKELANVRAEHIRVPVPIPIDPLKNDFPHRIPLMNQPTSNYPNVITSQTGSDNTNFPSMTKISYPDQKIHVKQSLFNNDPFPDKVKINYGETVMENPRLRKQQEYNNEMAMPVKSIEQIMLEAKADLANQINKPYKVRVI